MVLSRLFTDWVGWLSFLVIAFIVVMAVWFPWYFNRKLAESEAAEARAGEGRARPTGR
jgi:flagellar biosynthesis/type III secretory pathway M-ring protein FliF/YscJ